MENLDEIKGFITYADEEKKEKHKLAQDTNEDKKDDESNADEHKTISQLKEEVGEKIVNE